MRSRYLHFVYPNASQGRVTYFVFSKETVFIKGLLYIMPLTIITPGTASTYVIFILGLTLVSDFYYTN
jgi:hypothetical protein